MGKEKRNARRETRGNSKFQALTSWEAPKSKSLNSDSKTEVLGKARIKIKIEKNGNGRRHCPDALLT